MIDYAISTFCYGQRYYEQTNRLINELNKLSNPPKVFVVTDNPSKITNKDFVFIRNVDFYDKSYLNYEKNYYGFDFSVKRFSLRFALENGFTNIILTDTDVLPSNRFNNDSVMETFIENSISGQVTYLFENEVNTNSMLGRRLLHYEKKFKTTVNKDKLWMPEDCIQFISIEHNKFNLFLNTWDECIKIKYGDGLPNTPAGNIDEMCFSALKNGIELHNNSNKHINLLIPHHDKWY